jgi:hypothetical protein
MLWTGARASASLSWVAALAGCVVAERLAGTLVRV